MLRSILLGFLAAALLGACEMKIGKDEEGADANGAASAEGKAEEGSISIDVPGFGMKLDIPDAMRTEIGTDGDTVYPGSSLSGLHVQAGDDTGGADEGSADRGSVELRFASKDPIDQVAGWYRDPARAPKLAVASAAREGDGYRITGTSKEDGDPFTLHLSPAAGGGTEGRMTLRDREAR